MRTLKTIAAIILGLGAILVFNDNAEALYLNLIGAGCFLAFVCLIDDEKKTEQQ